MSNVFTKVFGGSPQVRLLDFLAGNLEFDYTITEMAERAGLSRPTVYALVDRLLSEGLLVHTRTVGRSRFYRINRANPVVLTPLRGDLAKARAAGEAAFADWRRGRSRGRRGRVPRALGGIPSTYREAS